MLPYRHVAQSLPFGWYLGWPPPGLTLRQRWLLEEAARCPQHATPELPRWSGSYHAWVAFAEFEESNKGWWTGWLEQGGSAPLGGLTAKGQEEED
ncbi:MAG: hypothetical protein ACE5JQ_00710 [Candidatus Methylomirabilales bacterium]